MSHRLRLADQSLTRRLRQINPFLGIMLASTHPDHPAEAITREQAVIAYTRTSAYAEFNERNLGTLEVGKLADLSVLLTFVGGNLAFTMRTRCACCERGGNVIRSSSVRFADAR